MFRRVAALTMAALTLSSCAVLGFEQPCDGLEIIGEFEQVGDLVEQANVQSSDVVVGTISKIELDEEDWVAQVTMCMKPDEKVPEDVEAVVRTTSLLGEKFVDLKPAGTGGPYMRDGDIIGVDQTSKATELEDVFARLGAILGTGNLEDLNRFTSAQARILEDNAGDFREVLSRLRRFTDLLASRKGDIAASIDTLDDVSRNVLRNQAVLSRFLDSFGDASSVLADQKEGLLRLLNSLDRFTDVGIRLLHSTEEGLTRQFARFRPLLTTLVNNSTNIRRTLTTLATFSDWFPETMPGDYLQLDICQALETTTQGTTCPQSDQNDDPRAPAPGPDPRSSDAGSRETGDLETIYRAPLEGLD